MSLTRDFKDTIKARIERDPAFRAGLLKEGVECLLSGDVDTGKAILRDYIKAQLANRMGYLVTAAARQARSLAPGARPTRWNQLR